MKIANKGNKIRHNIKKGLNVCISNTSKTSAPFEVYNKRICNTLAEATKHLKKIVPITDKVYLYNYKTSQYIVEVRAYFKTRREAEEVLYDLNELLNI